MFVIQLTNRQTTVHRLCYGLEHKKPIHFTYQSTCGNWDVFLVLVNSIDLALSKYLWYSCGDALVYSVTLIFYVMGVI